MFSRSMPRTVYVAQHWLFFNRGGLVLKQPPRTNKTANTQFLGCTHRGADPLHLFLLGATTCEAKQMVVQYCTLVDRGKVSSQNSFTRG